MAALLQPKQVAI